MLTSHCADAWRHPRRGMIAPDVFIPIAEDGGQIVPIGQWVLERACFDAARWKKLMRVADNNRPRQFKSCDLADLVAKVISRTGLKPSRLELEITAGF